MPLKRINIPDKNLQLMQDASADAVRGIEATPFQGGKLITGKALVSGQDNLIAHGLSRVPQMWVLAGVNVNTAVWSPVSTQLANAASSAQYLNLRCGTSCTVNVWVA